LADLSKTLEWSADAVEVPETPSSILLPEPAAGEHSNFAWLFEVYD
jgi:hypothetical protein